jgi:hypothetical protein
MLVICRRLEPTCKDDHYVKDPMVIIIPVCILVIIYLYKHGNKLLGIEKSSKDEES